MEAVRSAYRGEKIKSYGCNSHTWDRTCVGPQNCLFKKQLHTGKRQSRAADLNTFIQNWLPAKDSRGKIILKGSSVRVYLALERVERKRGYSSGSMLYVSWRELADLAGITSRSVGPALENLVACGLINYMKGAQHMGIASEVQRVLPVPRPENGMKKLHTGV